MLSSFSFPPASRYTEMILISFIFGHLSVTIVVLPLALAIPPCSTGPCTGRPVRQSTTVPALVPSFFCTAGVHEEHQPHLLTLRATYSISSVLDR